MKRVLTTVFAIITLASCQKELAPGMEKQIEGSWHTIELIEPDATGALVYTHVYDQPWISKVTFKFYSYHYGRRDNGDSTFPGAPRMMEFKWSQVDATTFHLEDYKTRQFNICTIIVRDDVATITETFPQFRQWIIKRD
jgi:hypothetical protein